MCSLFTLFRLVPAWFLHGTLPVPSHSISQIGQALAQSRMSLHSPLLVPLSLQSLLPQRHSTDPRYVSYSRCLERSSLRAQGSSSRAEVSCGGAKQQRSRLVLVEQSGRGKPCQGGLGAPDGLTAGYLKVACCGYLMSGGL